MATVKKPLAARTSMLAVSKYDEVSGSRQQLAGLRFMQMVQVIGTMDSARKVTGQFNKQFVDEAKDSKKGLRKEQQECQRQELVKVRVT